MITIVLAQRVLVKSIADFPRFRLRILTIMKIALISFALLFRKEFLEK